MKGERMDPQVAWDQLLAAYYYSATLAAAFAVGVRFVRHDYAAGDNR